MTVSIYENMNPLRRNTMEDVHVFHPPSSWDAPNDKATFIGVYDGHGGRGIVDYLEDHLAENVAQEWCHSCESGEGKCSDDHRGNKKRRLDDETVNSNEDENEGRIIRMALERAFLLTDIQSRMAGIQTSGATVACCIVLPHFSSTGALESISIHCANAGDARIVLSSSTSDSNSSNNSTAVRLTHDHKATDPAEVSRIQSSGGMMLRGRVLGVLAVARSLGDHGLKEFVIGRPFLSSTVISVEGIGTEPLGKDALFTNGEFLIVACDGLWDVMEDQEAVDLVRSFVGDAASVKKKREKAAEYLVEEALRRGSTDNITVIVYWL
jgi:serine/threonine protein phosphatase PrpC